MSAYPEYYPQYEQYDFQPWDDDWGQEDNFQMEQAIQPFGPWFWPRYRYWGRPWFGPGFGVPFAPFPYARPFFPFI